MSFDIWLFNVINHLPHGSFSDGIALFLSFMGQRGTAESIAGVLVVIGIFRADKGLWQNAMAILLATLSGSLAVDLMKMGFARPRPYEMLSDVYLVGEASGASFPSWHATFYAFFAAYVLMRITKRARFFWLSLGFLGGFVRIYQGFHYPSDIIAGWVLGAILAWLTAFLFSSFNRLSYNDSTS